MSFFEFDLIDAISSARKVYPKGDNDIGDDCFLFEFGEKKLAITKDLLVENVHFNLDFIDLYTLGVKSAAVNLSDIAAMGAKPLYAFLGLGIPNNTSKDSVVQFSKGFLSVLESFGCALSGGDVSRSDIFTVSVTLVGECEGAVLRRSTFNPGYSLAVTGTIGDSAAGLDLLLNPQNKVLMDDNFVDYLIKRHTLPAPRILEGMFLVEHGVFSGMDLSDGIASDLLRISSKSGVGLIVYEDRIPLSIPFLNFCNAVGIDNPYEFAISGGEDYELIVGIDSKIVTAVVNDFNNRFPNVGLTIIGEVVSGSDVLIKERNGNLRPIPSPMFSHFN